MKHYLVLILSLIPLFMYGQVEYKEEKTKINTIKKNAKYIYGEGFAPTEQEAFEMAELALRSEIMRVVSEKKTLQDSETVVVNAVKRNSSRIQLKRGTMDRIFLYVGIDQIFPSNNLITVQVGNETNQAETTGTEPAVNEERLLVETAIDANASDPEASTVPLRSSSAVINDVIQASSATVLLTYLKGQKENHKIMYGEVASDLNPAWYIVAIEGDRIRAVFDKGLSTRLNFLTGRKEPISQYSNDRKIWITTYE